jgi:hypothetical protein
MGTAANSPRDYARPHASPPAPLKPIEENPAATVLEHLLAMRDDYYEKDGCEQRLKTAEERQSEALAALPQGSFLVGAGGEWAKPYDNERRSPTEYLERELRSPNLINLQASIERARLASASNTLPLALDFSDAMKANNSVERALCHQLAMGHRLAMKFADRALAHLSAAEWEGQDSERRAVNLNLATKSAGTYARVSEACQRGFAALQARSGEDGRSVVVRQEVTVVHQHVHVDGQRKPIEGGAGHRQAEEAAHG